MSSISSSQDDVACTSSSESDGTTDIELENFLGQFANGGCWGYTIFRVYDSLNSSEPTTIPPDLIETGPKFTIQRDPGMQSSTPRPALAGRTPLSETSSSSRASAFDFEQFLLAGREETTPQLARARHAGDDDDDDDRASSALDTESQQAAGTQAEESELWTRIYAEIRRQMLRGDELPDDPISPRYQQSYQSLLRTPVVHLPGASLAEVRTQLVETEKQAYRENNVRDSYMCNTRSQNLGILVDKEVARSVLRGGPDAAVKVVESDYVPQLGPDGQDYGYMVMVDEPSDREPSDREPSVYYGWLWTRMSYLYLLWSHASDVGLRGCGDGHDFV